MGSDSAALDVSKLFVELGVLLILLALLARFAMRLGLSPIPFYLIAGLFFGSGGIISLEFPENFVQIGAEIGVILLLFTLGLVYTGSELATSVRSALPYGLLNLVLSFPPGLFLGLLLGWDFLAALLLGGVTYVSSSGIIAKTLNDLGWLGNRETPIVLSILVVEDMTMAVFLPLVAVLLVGEDLSAGMVSLGVAMTAAVVAMIIAIRFDRPVTRLVSSTSDEVLLLSVLALVLLVAGVAQYLQVSAAIGAFLVGIAISEGVAERAHTLVSPLRDLFAALFFLFFGLQIDPSTIPPVLGLALLLVLVSSATKFVTGYIAAQRGGIAVRGRWRAGTLLIPRGEFSIVIVGLAAASGLAEPQLAPLAASYVLLMAVIGPVLARVVDPTVAAVLRRRRRRREATAFVAAD
ncbi:MAG: cation:proton antiporter [Chloroflexota bacterium]